MANSAKQDPKVLTGHLRLAHGEFDGVTSTYEVELDVPVDGWITEVKVTLNPSTPFDQLVAMACEIYPERLPDYFSDAADIIDEVLDVWQTNDQVGSIIRPHPHFIWIMGSANTEPVIWHTDYFKFIKAGAQMDMHFSIADIGTAPTAGQVDIKFEAKFVVANFNGSPKRPSTWNGAAGYISVLASPDGADHEFALPVPTDCRIYNVRMAMLSSIGADTFYMNDEFMNDWDPYTALGTDTAEFSHLPQAYVNTLLPLSTDIVQNQNFHKGPFFYHKGDLIHFFINQGSANVGYYLCQFQLVPNYKNKVTFNTAYATTDLVDGAQRVVLTIPWDMYIETIEIDGTFVAAGDVSGFIEVHGIKPGNAGFTSTLANIGGGIIDLEGSAPETGIRAHSILDTIPVAADFSVTTNYQFTSLEMVMDYYPAGSQIILNPVNVANIAAFYALVQIEGTNAMKSGKVSKFDRILGEQISNMALEESP